MKKRRSKNLRVRTMKVANLVRTHGGSAAASWEFSCFSARGGYCPAKEKEA